VRFNSNHKLVGFVL